MAEDEGALVLWLNILRWSGLCFTKVRRGPQGELVAKDSAPHMVVNVAITAVFLVSFFLLDASAYERVAETYKSSAVVYPLYTKLMIMIIVVFFVCGNFYNRRFVGLINLVRRVTRGLDPEPGGHLRGRKRCGRKVLFAFLIYSAVSVGLSIWIEVHLIIYYNIMFRAVYYFCFYYLTIFTVHFILTMDYARENFRRLNAAFGRIGRQMGRLPDVATTVLGPPPSFGRKIRACMAVYMDLREVEEVANEIFGKQIFLMLVLAFSVVSVNAYYFITLNLYGTSYGWLNLAMWVGFLGSIMVVCVSTWAAEFAIREANRVSEVLLSSFLYFHDWQMHNRIKYFVLFVQYHPMKIKAWIFYAVSYESLLKVILTSSAITGLTLQCDFLRRSFRIPSNGTTSTPADAWN